jgi:type IV pilus assembly protein PilZ
MSEGPLTRAAISGPNTTFTAASQPGRPAVLSLAIKEKAALYAAYMPFLNNGGIFVPTTRKYELGDEVYLILTLMDDPNKLPVAGRIVWISPVGGARQPGIGVQFPGDESGIAARKKIEDMLGSTLKSGRPTHTI